MGGNWAWDLEPEGHGGHSQRAYPSSGKTENSHNRSQTNQMTLSALSRTGITHGWNDILKDSHKHWAGVRTPLLRNGQL